MYYHGTNVGNLKNLKPSVSLHGDSYVYLTTNRSVALVYTANAIESFYEKKGLKKPDNFQDWYSYGFTEDKLPRFEEYYPGAIKETYSGKSGYIYLCKEPNKHSNPTNIFCACVTRENVEVLNVEYIKDIYLEILRLESVGSIKILLYKDTSEEFRMKIQTYILKDIDKYNLDNKPEDNYTVFLKEKFPHLFKHFLKKSEV